MSEKIFEMNCGPNSKIQRSLYNKIKGEVWKEVYGEINSKIWWKVNYIIIFSIDQKIRYNTKPLEKEGRK